MAKLKIKPQFALSWVFDPLREDETYQERRMFGALVCYIEGRQVLAITDGDEPWNGLLVMTSREDHESLRRDFPELVSHEILGKWLYVSQAHPHFEEVAAKVVKRIQKRDLRIGIEPKPKKPKTRSKS